MEAARAEAARAKAELDRLQAEAQKEAEKAEQARKQAEAAKAKAENDRRQVEAQMELAKAEQAKRLAEAQAEAARAKAEQDRIQAEAQSRALVIQGQQLAQPAVWSPGAGYYLKPTRGGGIGCLRRVLTGLREKRRKQRVLLMQVKGETQGGPKNRAHH